MRNGATLISIIGPPASGKTTLAEALARVLPAGLIREDYAGNPFLAKSCLGQTELALPSQLYFLLSRAAQLSLADWPAEGLRVSDYGFCQDALYAGWSLAGSEYGLYDHVARRVGKLVRPPDLVIRLDACESTLLERIARRGRTFEQVMTAQFLRRMRLSYEQTATRLDCPVLDVDCDRTDLRQAEALASLVGQVREFVVPP